MIFKVASKQRKAQQFHRKGKTRKGATIVVVFGSSLPFFHFIVLVILLVVYRKHRVRNDD